MATLLLVEDTHSDEILTLHVLRKHRLRNQIVVARDGDEALGYLFGHPHDSGDTLPELPILVLLDMYLPKVDGLELLRRIRAHERTRALPVMLLTAADPCQLPPDLSGAHVWVTKPLRFGSFADAAQQLGMTWSLAPAGAAASPP